MHMVLCSVFSQDLFDSVENLIHRDIRHACASAEGAVFTFARNAVKAFDNNLVSPADRPRATGIGGTEKSHNRRLYCGCKMQRSGIGAHEKSASGQQRRGFRDRKIAREGNRLVPHIRKNAPYQFPVIVSTHKDHLRIEFIDQPVGE
jgi:hypothetical protein